MAKQLTGVVTDISSDLIGVNVCGADWRIPCVGTYIPAVGDVVTVDTINGRGRVTGPVIRGQRPLTGTVTVGASDGYVTVSAGGTTYRCRYVGTAATVGATVRLDWQATEPWIWSSAPASATPPAETTPTPSPPSVATVGTLWVVATDSAGWTSARGWTTSAPTQGTSNGAWSGAWFYGSKPSQIRGRDVTRFLFRLPRMGTTVPPRTVNLYRHTSNTRPSGDVSRVAGPTTATAKSDAAGWVTLPTIWGQAIVDLGGGIGIYGDPHVTLGGIAADAASGQLRIDWRA